MRIDKLQVHNFRGFSDTEIVLNGKDAIFYVQDKVRYFVLRNTFFLQKVLILDLFYKMLYFISIIPSYHII